MTLILIQPEKFHWSVLKMCHFSVSFGLSVEYFDWRCLFFLFLIWRHLFLFCFNCTFLWLGGSVWSLLRFFCQCGSGWSGGKTWYSFEILCFKISGNICLLLITFFIIANIFRIDFCIVLLLYLFKLWWSSILVRLMSPTFLLILILFFLQLVKT